MWKISRNFIFPRWHASKQTSVETKPKKAACKVLVALSSEKQRYSDDSHKKKENFRKESKRFWNCDQFLFRPLIFETAGWLGAVTVLCFNFHYKHFNAVYENDRKTFHCLFSRNVLAMPETPGQQKTVEPEASLPDKQSFHAITNEEIKNTEQTSETSFVEDLQINSNQYIAGLQNSAGVSCSDNDSKKAFRYFQTAARLGSSQGLYNLGLCYELGKGTRVNLNRAAFCYRKAAMKGHGLASFNLAVFFLKGVGGLPVDCDTAKLLLAEAADQDVPEAQIYMGIEWLEEKRWSEAFEVFDCLAKKDNLDGKYYLGLCYENGWGVSKDEKAAVEIFSQTATLGHSKSILKLVECYEKGLGSVESDLDFAEALCQILVDKGDEEGKKALQRIKTKKVNQYVKDSLEYKMSSIKLEKNTIHTSTSVPELTSSKRKTKYHPSFTSSYLDIITPFPVKSSYLHDNKKPSFFIGDDKLNLSLPTAYMSYYQSNHPIMVGKT